MTDDGQPTLRLIHGSGTDRSDEGASSNGRSQPTRSASELVDAEARWRIANSLDENLFVEAGAGSGKTSSLVERIVNLVASGVPVNKIAAITFTEAAARELRTRVRDELDSRGRATGDKALIAAAGQVEAAAFTTLHGFALRILTDHPVEAGLPPGFGVVDEITGILEFDEAWRVFLGRLGDDLDLEDLQVRALSLNVEFARFAGVARRFDDNWDLLELVKHDAPPLSPIGFDDHFDRLDELRSLLELCITPEDKYYKALADYIANIERLALKDELDQLQSFAQIRLPARNRGKSSSWRAPGLEHVRAEVGAFNDSLKAQAARYRDEVMDYIVVLVADFVADRVRTRQARGELSFHDLLVLARRLLRGNESVRQLLHQRYNRLLLDEFQDTDPIQIELAVLLAAPGPIDGRSWQDLAAEIPPGRLVVVGDPKQSIYRFRRADIGVYAQTESVLVESVTRLTTNFRSVPGILHWVNRLFGAVMGDGEPGVQPAYVSLDAARPDGPATEEREVPVTVLGGPHDGLPIREIRELEARDVAAVVCDVMANGWQVRDGSDWRPARLSDIAVLIPSRLTLPSLEAAFVDVNVPYRPETNSLVYATQEVRDVLSGVRATVEPANSISVVAALRSSLFSVGDDDLLDWKLAGGSWDYREPWPQAAADRSGGAEDSTGDPASWADHPVSVAYGQLREWHNDRWWIPPATFIERVIRDRRLREAALAESRPRDRWRRYRFLSEQARQFTEIEGGDLHDFVAWVEVQASDLARVTEPIPAEPDDDAVRVLTVHGSKGLEFPIVILAGAPTVEGPVRAGPSVLFPDGGRPQVRLGGDRQTAGYDLHAALEDVLDANERIRLHYVAATRAQDHLIVSTHHKKPGPSDRRSSIGRRTWEAIGDFGELWRPFEATGDEHYAARQPTQLRLAGDSWNEELSEWQHQQELIVTQARLNSPQSATSIAEAGATSGVALTVEADLDDPLRTDPSALDPFDNAGDLRARPGNGRSASGSALGSAVHRVLERADFSDLENVGDLSRLAAHEFGVEELALEVEQRARLALGSATIAMAKRFRHHREIYVAAPSTPSGAGVVEGFVDLLIETDSGLLIVDYKTDDVDSSGSRDAAIGEKVDRYRLQAATYAFMLAEVANLPIAGCRFLFVGADRVTEADVDDLPAAMGEARRLAAAIANRES